MMDAGRRQARGGPQFARARPAVILLLASALLSGCTGTGGRAQLSSAAQEASSAMQSARLAFQQYEKGATTGPIAEVTLEDANSELGTAQITATELTLPQRQDAKVQDQVVA